MEERADPSPEQEARRIAAVRRYDILDTPPDGAFDRIAALAARLFDAPAATVVEHAARERAERDRSEIAAYTSTLQRTLLPPALPEVPGLEAACHYTTASVHDVGGDFYDVFPLGAAAVGVLPRDVSGRGAPAAALASLIRYTLRSTALLERDLCAVLRALNSALLSASSDSSGLCTLVFGTLAPEPAGGFALTLAGGGHLPAHHLRPARRDGPDRAVARTEPVSLAGGMLVGALHHADFVFRAVQLLPGEGLFLYSNGLTEARTSQGARFGERGLTAHLTHHAATNRALGAATIISDLTSLLDSSPRDPPTTSRSSPSARPRQHPPRHPPEPRAPRTPACLFRSPPRTPQRRPRNRLRPAPGSRGVSGRTGTDPACAQTGFGHRAVDGRGMCTPCFRGPSACAGRDRPCRPA